MAFTTLVTKRSFCSPQVAPYFRLRRYGTETKQFKNVDLTGVYPILATPFNPKEELDILSWTRMLQFMANEVKVSGVTILGVLGESNRLTDKEREIVIDTAVKAVGGRIPIVVGTSHTGTHATCELSRMAQDLGASAVMVTPQREATPSDEKIFEYFSRIGQSIDIPIVLQDHPASTLVHMSVPLIIKIVNSIPGVTCVKAEAVPTPGRVEGIRKGVNRPVSILGGLGALYGMFELQVGCDGFMTGFAFPEVLQALVHHARQGNFELVESIYQSFLPLIVYEQQPGVAIRKEFLRRRGLIEHNTVRHPGGSLTNTMSEQISKLLLGAFPNVDISKVIPQSEFY